MQINRRKVKMNHAIKQVSWALLFTLLLSSCGTNMPVQKIAGKDNEYVLNRDDKTPFANLPAVKESVKADATTYCSEMNKDLFENYSIDKERAVFVWPETTMYFSCIAKK